MSRPRRPSVQFLLPALLVLGLAAATPTVVRADEAAAAAAATDVQKIPNEKCFKCHDDPEAEDDNGGSIAVIAAQFGAGAHLV